MRAFALLLAVVLMALALQQGNILLALGFAGLGGLFYLHAPHPAREQGKTLPLRVLAEAAEPQTGAVLDALLTPIVIITPRGVILYANEAARSTFPGLRQGYPFSAAIRAPDVLTALENVQARGGAAQVDLVEHVPVERSFALDIRRLPGAAQERREDIIVIHMSETTKARRIEAMRVDFVANASHELRTPLASILGFIETLQGPAKDDVKARGHFLDIMANQARRMARLIDDLLSLSKIEMHAHIAPSATVDLALILPELVDALSGLAQERKVAVHVAPLPPHALVQGDRDEVLRLFENLFENAIKYGQSGKRVDLAMEREEAEWRVTVRDYGPGIAAEHLPRLTERFYRADIQESRILGGTGLGLAIVKHIISRHRGRLAIESREGEGARFIVSLPALPEKTAHENAAP